MASSRMLSRSAFDCSHVQGVKVLAMTHLSYPGRMAARIVANFSDNPNGSVCTATLHFFDGPLAIIPATTGTAGGGGYDKFSAAVADALDRAYALPADARVEGTETIHSPAFSYFSHPNDKSAWEALQSRKLDTLLAKDGGWRDMHGAGISVVRAFLESHGYTVLEVVG